MTIPEPRLTGELEDDDQPLDDRCWHGDALRCLAKQLGVGNDFYFPLLSAAQLLDGRTLSGIEAAKRHAVRNGGAKRPL